MKRQPKGRPRNERPDASTLAGSLAQQIDLLRQRRGLTHAELGKLAGVGSATIGRIERAETSPSIDTVAAIAAALGVKPRELMSRCVGW